MFFRVQVFQSLGPGFESRVQAQVLEVAVKTKAFLYKSAEVHTSAIAHASSNKKCAHESEKNQKLLIRYFLLWIFKKTVFFNISFRCG